MNLSNSMTPQGYTSNRSRFNYSMSDDQLEQSSDFRLFNWLSGSFLIGTSLYYGYGMFGVYTSNNLIQNSEYIKTLVSNKLYSNKKYFKIDSSAKFALNTKAKHYLDLHRHELDEYLKNVRTKLVKKHKPKVSYAYVKRNIGAIDNVVVITKSVLDDIIKHKFQIPGIDYTNHIKFPKEHGYSNTGEVNSIGATIVKNLNEAISYKADFNYEIIDDGIEGYKLRINGKAVDKRFNMLQYDIKYPKIVIKGNESLIYYNGNVYRDTNIIKNITATSDSIILENVKVSELLKANRVLNRLTNVIESPSITESSSPRAAISKVTSEVQRVLDSTLLRYEDYEKYPRLNKTVPFMDFYSKNSVNIGKIYDFSRRNSVLETVKKMLHLVHANGALNSSTKNELLNQINKYKSEMLGNSLTKAESYSQYLKILNTITDQFNNSINKKDIPNVIIRNPLGGDIAMPINVYLSSLNSSLKGNMATGNGVIYDLLGFGNLTPYQKNIRQYLLAARVSNITQKHTKLDRRKFGFFIGIHALEQQNAADAIRNYTASYIQEYSGLQSVTDHTALMKLRSTVVFNDNLYNDGLIYGVENKSNPLFFDTIKKLYTDSLTIKSDPDIFLSRKTKTIKTIPVNRLNIKVKPDTMLDISDTHKNEMLATYFEIFEKMKKRKKPNKMAYQDIYDYISQLSTTYATLPEHIKAKGDINGYIKFKHKQLITLQSLVKHNYIDKLSYIMRSLPKEKQTTLMRTLAESGNVYNAMTFIDDLFPRIKLKSIWNTPKFGLAGFYNLAYSIATETPVNLSQDSMSKLLALNPELYTKNEILNKLNITKVFNPNKLSFKDKYRLYNKLSNEVDGSLFFKLMSTQNEQFQDYMFTPNFKRKGKTMGPIQKVITPFSKGVVVPITESEMKSMYGVTSDVVEHIPFTKVQSNVAPLLYGMLVSELDTLKFNQNEEEVTEFVKQKLQNIKEIGGKLEQSYKYKGDIEKANQLKALIKKLKYDKISDMMYDKAKFQINIKGNIKSTNNVIEAYGLLLTEIVANSDKRVVYNNLKGSWLDKYLLKTTENEKQKIIGFKDIFSNVAVVNTNMEHNFGVNPTINLLHGFSSNPASTRGVKTNLYNMAFAYRSGRQDLVALGLSNWNLRNEQTGYNLLETMLAPNINQVVKGRVLTSFFKKYNGATTNAFRALYAKADSERKSIYGDIQDILQIIKKNVKDHDAYDIKSFLSEGLDLDSVGISELDNYLRKLSTIASPKDKEKVVDLISNIHNKLINIGVKYEVPNADGSMATYYALPVAKNNTIKDVFNDINKVLSATKGLDPNVASKAVKGKKQRDLYKEARNLSIKMKEAMDEITLNFNKTVEYKGQLKYMGDSDSAILIPKDITKFMSESMFVSDINAKNRDFRLRNSAIVDYLSLTTAYVSYASQLSNLQDILDKVNTGEVKLNSSYVDVISYMYSVLKKIKGTTYDMGNLWHTAMKRFVDMSQGKKKGLSFNSSLASINGTAIPKHSFLDTIAKSLNDQSKIIFEQLYGEKLKTRLKEYKDAGILKGDVNKVYKSIVNELHGNVFGDVDFRRKFRTAILDYTNANDLAANNVLLTIDQFNKYAAEDKVYSKAFKELNGTSQGRKLLRKLYYNNLSSNILREPSIEESVWASGTVGVIDSTALVKGIDAGINTEMKTKLNSKLNKVLDKYLVNADIPLEVLDGKVLNVNEVATRINSKTPIFDKINVDTKTTKLLSDLALNNIHYIGSDELNTVHKLDFDSDMIGITMELNATKDVSGFIKEMQSLLKDSSIEYEGKRVLAAKLRELPITADDATIASFISEFNEFIHTVPKEKLKGMENIKEFYDPSRRYLKSRNLDAILRLYARSSDSSAISQTAESAIIDNIVKVSNDVQDKIEFYNTELFTKYGDVLKDEIHKQNGAYTLMNLDDYIKKIYKNNRPDIAKKIANKVADQLGYSKSELDRKTLKVLINNPNIDKDLRKQFYTNSGVKSSSFDEHLKKLLTLSASDGTPVDLDKFYTGQMVKIDTPEVFPAHQKLEMLLDSADEILGFKNTINNRINKEVNIVNRYKILNKPEEISKLLQLSSTPEKINTKGVRRYLSMWLGNIEQKVISSKHGIPLSVAESISDDINNIIAGKMNPEEIEHFMNGDVKVSTEILKRAFSDTPEILDDVVGNERISTVIGQLEKHKGKAKVNEMITTLKEISEGLNFKSYIKPIKDNTIGGNRWSENELFTDAHAMLTSISEVMGVQIRNEPLSHGKFKQVTLGETFKRAYDYITNKGAVEGDINVDTLNMLTIAKESTPLFGTLGKFLHTNRMSQSLLDSKEYHDQIRAAKATDHLIKYMEDHPIDHMITSKLRYDKPILRALAPIRKSLMGLDTGLTWRRSKQGLGLVALGFLAVQAITPKRSFRPYNEATGIGTDQFEDARKMNEYNMKKLNRERKLRIYTAEVLPASYKSNELRNIYQV